MVARRGLPATQGRALRSMLNRAMPPDTASASDATLHLGRCTPISFRLDFNDVNALVAATRGADLVRQAQLMAFGAGHQIPGPERMMATPVAFPALAKLSFW
jgi:hypothetical protein